MSRTTKQVYRFGPFCLNTNDHVLLRGSESVPLTLKSFKTLLVLVENTGNVVERGELLEEVWPNTFVEEANLTQQIFTLRKILGADENGRQYIETVPKLGYRFTAPVSLRTEVGRPAETNLAQARTVTNDTLPDKPIDSVAVLPWASVGNDPETEYLSDAVTESIINNLSRLPQLRVRALSTVFRYKGREVDPQKIGRELNVQALVTGKIIKLDDRFIFRVELVDVLDGSQLFGKEYKRRLCSIFEVQGEISTAISRDLQIKLAIENDLLKHQSHP